MSRKIKVDGRLVPVPYPKPDASLNKPSHPIMFPVNLPDQKKVK